MRANELSERPSGPFKTRLSQWKQALRIGDCAGFKQGHVKIFLVGNESEVEYLLVIIPFDFKFGDGETL